MFYTKMYVVRPLRAKINLSFTQRAFSYAKIFQFSEAPASKVLTTQTSLFKNVKATTTKLTLNNLGDGPESFIKEIMDDLKQPLKKVCLSRTYEDPISEKEIIDGNENEASNNSPMHCISTKRRRHFSCLKDKKKKRLKVRAQKTSFPFFTYKRLRLFKFPPRLFPVYAPRIER
eukprot:Platyproteum_vivax@DN3685_c0_g1_i1.p1